MAATYPYGQLVNATVALTNSAGVAADASTVILRVRNPSGVATHVYGQSPSQIARGATGIYHVQLSGVVEGEWAHKWTATGGIQTASETQFFYIDEDL